MSSTTIVFFDGQNLYHSAKDAWAPDKSLQISSPYNYPCYDVEKLATALVNLEPGRTLKEIRFYTGVPDPNRGPQKRFWHGFWSNKLRYLKSKGIYIYWGRVNRSGQEKGVDVSIAVDLIRLTYEQAYDTAIIVSQDWDFGPAVRLAKQIAKDQKRWLVFESAFCVADNAIPLKPRSVPGTKWIYINKSLYDSCIDPTDYRPLPIP